MVPSTIPRFLFFNFKERFWWNFWHFLIWSESWVVLCSHTWSQDCHSPESFKGQGSASFLYKVHTLDIVSSQLKKFNVYPPGTRTPVFSLSPRSCTGPAFLDFVSPIFFHLNWKYIIFCFIDRSAVEQVPTKDYECPLGKVGKMIYGRLYWKFFRVFWLKLFLGSFG